MRQGFWTKNIRTPELNTWKGLTFEDVCRLFQAERSGVLSAARTVANYLGTAISNQLNSYPMDRLIITGRMLELGAGFQTMLEKNIKSNVFPSVRSGLSVHFIRLDHDNSLARGAAIFSERTSGLLSS